MKCLFIIFISLIVSFTANCQFMLTPKGFVDSLATDKNYIVFEFPNLTQCQISDKVNLYLSSISKSPKDQISKVDTTLITVNGFCERCIYKEGWDMNYNILFRFKQGKLRIESPSFELFASRGNQVKMVLVTQDVLDLLTIGIYNKKGVLKYSDFRDIIESYFNDYVQKLISSVNGVDKNDHW
jgi:hypothetical protein